MFLGTHTPKLDDKGRLILPAKFRDELADGLVITRFQERCLAIWPISSFVAILMNPGANPHCGINARSDASLIALTRSVTPTSSVRSK